MQSVTIETQIPECHAEIFHTIHLSGRPALKERPLCCTCPDITSLTQFVWLPCSWTGPLQSFFPLCLCRWHCFQTQFSLSGGVGGDGNDGCSRRQALLYSATPVDSRDLPLPPTHPPSSPPPGPPTHLLGGKAWISPFPLSLALKRLLSPSHLAPLLSFPLLPCQTALCFYSKSPYLLRSQDAICFIHLSLWQF